MRDYKELLGDSPCFGVRDHVRYCMVAAADCVIGLCLMLT
jgi:hypothetical protein